MKICTRCKIELDADAFPRSSSRCKKCMAEVDRKRRLGYPKSPVDPTAVEGVNPVSVRRRVDPKSHRVYAPPVEAVVAPLSFPPATAPPAITADDLELLRSEMRFCTNETQVLYRMDTYRWPVRKVLDALRLLETA